MFSGRGASDEVSSNYSLFVACFAGSVTAIGILIIGLVLTVYRRNGSRGISSSIGFLKKKPLDSSETETSRYNVIKNNNRASPVVLQKPNVKRKEHPSIDEIDTIHRNSRSNRSISDDPATNDKIHDELDTWIHPNGYVDKALDAKWTCDLTNPTRPSTLPVHRTHDIYTRSLRVQESCI